MDRAEVARYQRLAKFHVSNHFGMLGKCLFGGRGRSGLVKGSTPQPRANIPGRAELFINHTVGGANPAPEWPEAPPWEAATKALGLKSSHEGLVWPLHSPGVFISSMLEP